MHSHFWDRTIALCYHFFYYFFLPFHFPLHSLSCSPSLSPSSVSLWGNPSIAHQNMLSPISALSPYPHIAANLVLSVHSFSFHYLSRALRPFLFTLSFIFSLPLYFPFSLHLEFVGLGCGSNAMLGVVGLRWFFVDRGSLRWFVVGLCGGLVSGFYDLISVSFNVSGFDWFWWVLDFNGWVRGLIEVALGAGCGLIGVVLGLCCDFVILWFGWFFVFVD